MDRLAFNAAAAINEGRTARQMTTNEWPMWQRQALSEALKPLCSH